MAKLKTLPKALIVGAIIAGAGFAIVKFMPAKAPTSTPEEAASIDTPPAAPPSAPMAAENAANAVQAATEAAQPQQGNVTNGSAGLDSVLKAGKK